MTSRTFQIYRYDPDPDADAKPRTQTIEAELDGSERMLLDALSKLKAVDPSLSFRRSRRPTASSPTAATRARPSGWTTSKTRTACSDATPS